MRSTLALLPGNGAKKMGWPSYAEDIIEIGCDLEHLAGCSVAEAERDFVSGYHIVAAAERLVSRVYDAFEIVTDPNLDSGSEITALRARALELEKQQRLDKELIQRLSRDVATRATETAYWRDECFKLSRQKAKVRRRRTARRRR